jgi:cell wall assembly regulator SMI1
MTPTQWKALLTAWSTQLLTTDLTSHLDPADRKLKYLGFPAASASAIASLESRLGVTLPPSYRTFLEATDGFRVISPFTYRLRPAADVDWFRVENQGWIETYNEPTYYDNPEMAEPTDEEYFDYSNSNELNFRSNHLFAMLQISDTDDGVMLLNPLAVTPDGEWEAWFFANWIPGANRYASFAHMMAETYCSLRKLEKLPNKPKLPTIKIPSPKIPRRSVIENPKPYDPKGSKLKRKKGQSQLEYIAQFLADEEGEKLSPAPPELVKLLNDLKNSDPKARGKAIRILRGKLKVRAMSTRHTNLVPRAAELARTLPDPEARSVCVSLLTNITPDGPVPEWLITALNDPHPWVQDAALYAIYYFKGPELVEPIIKILSAATDMQAAQRAASSLSEIADARAVPELAAQLQRTFPPPVGAPPEILQQHFQMHYAVVAMALAKYGPHAISHLTSLLLHTDPNRRSAAIVGLRVLGDPASRAAVAELKSDPDPGVRKQAEMCDRFWGNQPGFTPHATIT